MKNIHILPTNKPSRLHLWTDENGSRFELCELEYSHTRNTHHIYITSNEEIKEGDWYISTHETSINQCSSFNKEILNKAYWAQKIILTTDQEFIADGVQTIDDEFLEWFVKNPSCEFVPIITTIVLNKSTYKTNIGFESWRKKEEPKQTVEEYEQQGLEKYSHELKQELPGIGGTSFKVKVNKDWFSKQETLEEAAEKYRNNQGLSIRVSRHKGFLDGAKWQQERMYSEDEVKHIISEALQSALVTVDLEQWFEQFKKK